MMDNQYNIDNLHAALLVLLKEFDRICVKYKINYSIGFGTLLGAVRHKGFIPWDDDVDIMIPRKEFEKIQKVPETEFGEKFFFQTVKTDPGYPYNTARLRLNNSSMIYDKWINAGFNQGIYIDIITYDNIPDNSIKAMWQKAQIIFYTPFRFLRNKDVFFNGGKNIPLIVKRIMYALLSKLPLDSIYERELKVEQKYSNTNTKMIGFLGEGNLFLKKWYPLKPISSHALSEFCRIEFEDTEFSCSCDYKELLSQWYGDYMKLPPKEKQVIYHQPCYFSTTVSYKEYIEKIGD